MSKRYGWVAALFISFGGLCHSESIEQPIYYCLPPPDPILDPVILEIYDQTVLTEFSTFYDDANAYLLCLQRTQAAWIAHVNELTRTYQELSSAAE